MSDPATLPPYTRSIPMAPLHLPGQLMRRAGVVALAVLLLALVQGLWRADRDIEEEVDAAIALASMVARLGQLAGTDDTSALKALQALQFEEAQHPLRHLVLQVHAQDGRVLLGPPPVPALAPPLGWLVALHRDWLSPADVRQVRWQVPRADGSLWTVSLAASHDSERREAMASLLAQLLLLALCVAGLLLAMRWNMRQAFAPLGRLVAAIGGIEQQDLGAVRALPTMPIGELETVAAALRHLGGALAQAEAQRRQLSQQVLTLQDDERVRLAQDLHDEFGQRLTALRVDAAWLAHQVAEQPALTMVVAGMAQQCEALQHDVRGLLGRLQPFGPADDADSDSLADGAVLLQRLVDSWNRSGAVHYQLVLHWHDAAGQLQPWPAGDAAQVLRLPRPLWRTLYRISQEALTNVARHAQAGDVLLQLDCRGDARPGAPLRIDWQACDDGIGLPLLGQGADAVAAALPRGNGLAGLQQRVWAQGGALHCAPWRPGAARPGLRLATSIDARLLAAPVPAAQNRSRSPA